MTSETGTAPEPLAAVLFDLGGVVVELGSVTDLFGRQAAGDADGFWDRWIHSSAVSAYERGETTTDVFAQAVVEEFDLAIDAQQFIKNFAAWPQGLFDGIAAVLASIPDSITTATVSNTNELHWQSAFDRMTLHDRFDRHYPSFQLGVAKPTDAYFEAVLTDLDAELGVQPSQVGFLDDNQVNVDAARRHGMRAERVQGASEARYVLTEWRVITESRLIR